MNHEPQVVQNVRRALKRAAPAAGAPVPPAIPEPIVRLVHSEIGLAELFTRMARQNQMQVQTVRPDELTAALAASLHSHGCQRIALAASETFDRLALAAALRSQRLEVTPQDQIPPEELYAFDAGVTDVRFAVAETGSLVIEGSRGHGRALSLVPPVHLAVVQPQSLLPDLLDLFQVLSRDPRPGNSVIITGPSKTADIEMNLVTGVHGPGVVEVFLLH